ncbi:MAG TPA: hypothetical protein VIX91_14885 [Candidatus Acidoferrum sp.]|jgi:hypothetical protein
MINNPHFLSRTCPADQPFDLEAIEAISRAYQAACWKLGVADHDDASCELVAQHVIGLAQTGVRDPSALYRLTVKKFRDKIG